MCAQIQGEPEGARRKGKVNYNEVPASIRRRPYYVVLPGLIILIGILIPFVMAITLSLTNFSFKVPTVKFVFLKNWINLFTDPDFFRALWVTLRYALYATGVQMILGTCVALLLRKDSVFSRILKVLLTFPLMVAPAIAVLIWQLMTSNSVGVLEKFLNLFGVYNFPWAASSQTAMFTAVLIDTWVNVPFVILLVLAGIQSLPKSPFEAAQVDGAGAWFTFKTLTFPMLKPFMYIALLFRLMASLQEFGIIFALTQGRPGQYADEPVADGLPDRLHLPESGQGAAVPLGPVVHRVRERALYRQAPAPAHLAGRGPRLKGGEER